jgi:hypothetical protein
VVDNLKGIIIVASREYARELLGEEKTQELLEKSGLADKAILATKDYPNKLGFAFITLVGKERGLGMLEAVQEGARYFANTYAPQNYRAFYIINRDLKKALNNFQKICSIALEGQEIGNYAAIDTAWPDEQTVRIRYDSPLQNTAYPKGLVQGLSDYYQTPVQLRDLSNIEFEVQLKG